MATGFPDYSIGFVGAVTVPNGGTGLSTVPVGALLVGNGTAAMGTIGPAANDQVLFSQGTNQAPIFTTSITIGKLALAATVSTDIKLQIGGVNGQTANLIACLQYPATTVFSVDPSGNVAAASLALSTPLPVASGGTGVAVCTAGQLLTGTGANTAAFQTIPGARVYNSAGVVCGTGVFTACTFDSERFNDGPMHSTSTNPSRLTCTLAGVYDIKFSWGVTGITNPSSQIRIRLNGTTYIALDDILFDANNYSYGAISTHYKLAVNDYVDAGIYNIQAGNLTLVAQANYSPEFSAVWVKS